MDADELYRTCLSLCDELDAARVERPERVKELVPRLREKFVELLLRYPEEAADKGADEKLWKRCFYTQIDTYRRALRKASAPPVSEANSLVALSTTALLQEHIAEATSFYQDLLIRQEDLLTTRTNSRIQAQQALLNNIHTTLIFLGDLARYSELHSESREKSFVLAESYYYRALALCANSGNPHNRLAVVAQIVKSETLAVYRFTRALLAERKFVDAEENLANLFKTNREAVQHQAPDRDIEQRLAKANSRKRRGAEDEKADILQKFLKRFVRLHGILFQRRHQRRQTDFRAERRDVDADIGAFMHTYQSVCADLDVLIKHLCFSDILLVKMLVICIFSVVNNSKPSSKTSKARRSVNEVAALALIFRFMAKVTSSVNTEAVSRPRRNTYGPIRLLMCISVFCDWLHCDRKYLAHTDAMPQDQTCSKESWRMTLKAEHDAREEFEQASLSLLNTIEEAVRHGFLPVSLSGADPENSCPLKEHIELRGFEPLATRYEPYFSELSQGLTVPPLSSQDICPKDEVATRRRLVCILNFLSHMHDHHLEDIRLIISSRVQLDGRTNARSATNTHTRTDTRTREHNTRTRTHLRTRDEDESEAESESMSENSEPENPDHDRSSIPGPSVIRGPQSNPDPGAASVELDDADAQQSLHSSNVQPQLGLGFQESELGEVITYKPLFSHVRESSSHDEQPQTSSHPSAQQLQEESEVVQTSVAMLLGHDDAMMPPIQPVASLGGWMPSSTTSARSLPPEPNTHVFDWNGPSYVPELKYNTNGWSLGSTMGLPMQVTNSHTPTHFSLFDRVQQPPEQVEIPPWLTHGHVPTFSQSDENLGLPPGLFTSPQAAAGEFVSGHNSEAGLGLGLGLGLGALDEDAHAYTLPQVLPGPTSNPFFPT